MAVKTYLALATTAVVTGITVAQYNLNQPSVPFPLGGGGGGGFGGGGGGGGGGDKDPIEHLSQAIAGGGVPGQDYPILAAVPETGFSCQEQIPGYYADTNEEAGCQVFHICQFGGRIDSFLCPNGTIFNQQYFVCDWWYNFDCSTAEQFYELNAQLGQAGDNGDGGNGAPSTSYGAPGRGGGGGGNGVNRGGFGGNNGGGFGGNSGGGFGGNSGGGNNRGSRGSGINRGTPSASYSAPGGGGDVSAPSGLYQSPRA